MSRGLDVNYFSAGWEKAAENLSRSTVPKPLFLCETRFILAGRKRQNGVMDDTFRESTPPLGLGFIPAGIRLPKWNCHGILYSLVARRGQLGLGHIGAVSAHQNRRTTRRQRCS